MAAGDRNDMEAGAREAIAHLASFDRPSASEGEQRAARWIAGRLDTLGAPAVVERESAHGGYWWPLGLMTLLAGLASLTRSRLAWALT